MKMLEYIALRLLIEAKWRESLGNTLLPEYREVHTRMMELQKELGFSSMDSLFCRTSQEQIDREYRTWQEARWAFYDSSVS